MNDDLKAYVDGELPPDAAERLRESLAADPALALEGEGFRRLAAAIRSLPEPMPVGQAATLAALARRRPLWRGWTVALAGCTAVLLVVSTLPSRMLAPSQYQSAAFERVQPQTKAALAPMGARSQEGADFSIPAERQEEFTKAVETRGGKIEREGDGLKARYPKSAHEDVVREFVLPRRTPWNPGGMRFRVRS